MRFIYQRATPLWYRYMKETLWGGVSLAKYSQQKLTRRIDELARSVQSLSDRHGYRFECLKALEKLTIEHQTRNGGPPRVGDIVKWRGARYRVTRVWKYTIALDGRDCDARVRCHVPVASGGLIGAKVVQRAASRKKHLEAE